MGIRAAAFIPGTDIMIGEIPVGYWCDVSPDEFDALVDSDGVVVGDACSLLWAALGKTGEAPHSLQVRVNGKDVDALDPTEH